MGPRAIALALLLAPALAHAMPNEPRGFGEVRFGMSQAEVKRVLPGVQPGPQVADGLLQFLRVEKQSAYGLSPCAVTLRFTRDALYEIIFDCGREAPVVAALRKEFGEPTRHQPDSAFWLGERATVALNRRARTFAISDRRRMEQVQRNLLGAVLRQRAKDAARDAGAPGAALAE